MLTETAMVALTIRYQRRLAQITDPVARISRAAWDSLARHDEEDVDQYAALIARPVAAAKQATVSVSSGYYSALATTRPPPLAARDVPVDFDPRVPFISFWQALGSGSVDDALASGASRAQAVVGDFVTSTGRQTGGIVTRSTGQTVVGWRRVLTGVSCVWCATVATRRYHSAESADFGHDRCNCGAVPIYGDADPGVVINQPVLDALKQRGPQYWKDRGAVDIEGQPAEFA